MHVDCCMRVVVLRMRFGWLLFVVVGINAYERSVFEGKGSAYRRYVDDEVLGFMSTAI